MAVLVSQLTTLLCAGSASWGDSCRPILDEKEMRYLFYTLKNEHEISPLLDCYQSYSGNSLPTFRDRYVVPKRL
jgi:hypothetical protein